MISIQILLLLTSVLFALLYIFINNRNALIVGLMFFIIIFMFFYGHTYLYQEETLMPRNHFTDGDIKMFLDKSNNQSYVTIHSDDFDITPTYAVRGSSMGLSLPSNSRLLKRTPKNDTDFFVGDIVSYFHTNDKTVINHRIVEIDGDMLLVKGDSNKYLDGWINKSDVEYIILGVLY